MDKALYVLVLMELWEFLKLKLFSICTLSQSLPLLEKPIGLLEIKKLKPRQEKILYMLILLEFYSILNEISLLWCIPTKWL